MECTEQLLVEVWDALVALRADVMIASLERLTLQEPGGEPLASRSDSDYLLHLVLFTFACLGFLVVILVWRHVRARQSRWDARYRRRKAVKSRHWQPRPEVRS